LDGDCFAAKFNCVHYVSPQLSGIEQYLDKLRIAANRNGASFSVSQTIPTAIEMQTLSIKSHKNACLIMDDVTLFTKQKARVNSIVNMEGAHMGITNFFLQQNPFESKGLDSVTMYEFVIVFKNRQYQISFFCIAEGLPT